MITNCHNEHSIKSNNIFQSLTSLNRYLLQNNFKITSNLVLLSDKPEKSFHHFKSKFENIVASGGIVLNKDRELLLIFKNGFWDLPKGKVEVGEDVLSTAVREINEETNVSTINLISDCPSTYHIFQDSVKKNVCFLKETKWFYFHSTTLDTLSPQKSEGIEDVQWVSLESINEKKIYKSVKDLVILFFDL